MTVMINNEILHDSNKTDTISAFRNNSIDTSTYFRM